MSQVTLAVRTGRPTGSAASRRLRAEDRIPAVLYGHGMAPLAVSVERRALRIALSGPGGFNTLLSLDVDGKRYPAIIKELQRHPIRRTVSHIDFLQVNVNEEITIHVPVRLEGEAKAVLMDGGMVDPAIDTIEITCTPNTMPTEIVIDISEMRTGDVIRIEDVVLPEGTSTPMAPDTPVVTALHGAVTPEAEEAEGEAPAEAEAEAADTED